MEWSFSARRDPAGYSDCRNQISDYQFCSPTLNAECSRVKFILEVVERAESSLVGVIEGATALADGGSGNDVGEV